MTAGCRPVIVDGTVAVAVEVAVFGIVIVSTVIIIDINICIRAISSCDAS